MNFASALKSTLDDNKVLTENGAVAYETSGKALVDINFAISELRGASDADIQKRFAKAFFENKKLAVVWLFFSRDVRGGMGERRLFRICLDWLVGNAPDCVRDVIELIPEYGRFDDMFGLVGTSLEDDMFKVISRQFNSDIENMGQNKPISLLAKWLPSITTSSTKTVELARRFAARFGRTEREYRKTLSAMRRYLDVTEVKTSANEWSSIDYSKVSSQANLKYKNAFIKHDETRRQEFLKKLESGEEKINASTAFPHDICNIYANIWHHTNASQLDPTAEAMWKALPNYVTDDSNTICVVDGSASMDQLVYGSNVLASTVANALGIYFAEHMSETSPFKNKFITFSAHPRLIDLQNCTSLYQKFNYLMTFEEYSNTNLERTMKLILDTAVRNNAKQSDIPNILILSDMNFDSMVDVGGDYYDNYGSRTKTLMENIAEQFKAHGYRLPRITFWNICGGISRHAPTPMQQNEAGIALVSGFSPAIASMVYSSKLDPFEVLVEKLMSARYEPVMERVSRIFE